MPLNNITDNSFRFFVDQVTRQYQELKTDIKYEVGELRRQLLYDAKEQALELKEFKKEAHERFENIEKQIIDLQAWKWYIAGAAAVSFALAEVALRAFDYYMRK